MHALAHDLNLAISKRVQGLNLPIEFKHIEKLEIYPFTVTLLPPTHAHTITTESNPWTRTFGFELRLEESS